MQPLSNWSHLAAQCERLLEPGGGRLSFPRAVSLACSLETARCLPLCIQVVVEDLYYGLQFNFHNAMQGRLRHGFHFTLKSILKDTAVTFVVSRGAGTLVSQERPFAAQGGWLQVGDSPV